MRCVRTQVAVLLVFVLIPTRINAGLIINLTNNGGSAPTTTGTGTLASVVRAAADVWELAFDDSGFNHTVLLEFRWAALGGGTLGAHSLLSQAGSPFREDYGMIDFDNDGSSSFFLDGTLDVTSLATLTASSSEFTTFSTSNSDLGGGSMNVQRSFTGATGAAAGRHDLFTVALHEIGHALGLSSGNFSYLGETGDNDVDVTGGMPFSGATISVSSAHTSLANTLMFSSLSAGIRKLPTAADIVANAQISQFTDPNHSLSDGLGGGAAPEPSSLLLASVLGGVGCALRVRQRRRESGKSASA
jgi:hypothetical protein